MTSAIQSENEDNIRLRKANEFIAHCKEAEAQARIALADAVKRTQLARAKHETLFLECEKRASARRASGQIEVSSCY